MSLAIGLATMFYSQDPDRIAESVKSDAIVASAEARFQRLHVLALLDIAFTSGEITRHEGSFGEAPCKRIEDDLLEANDHRDLAWRQTIHQFVCVLFGLGRLPTFPHFQTTQLDASPFEA
ncbi:MAG TPA: hypothetical protein VGP19_12575 [Candidatus Acidoferrales bacterium]|jgi:hypothetical protein|nr:hypothetical protein [Candidatus Acidoferrales bacterium]